jgi:hypothetical protein
MAGKSPLSATDAQRAEFALLANSRERREADRARVVLLTLAGWTSGRIAQAFAGTRGYGSPVAKRFCAWPRRSAQGHRRSWPSAGEEEVERIGLRLKLLKQLAEADEIVLLFGDESEAFAHPYLPRVWAKSGADLRVSALEQAKKVAMLGFLDYTTRQLIFHTSKTKRSSDFVAHLEQLDRLSRPKPGRCVTPVVLVEDTPANSRAQPSPPAPIGCASSGCPHRPRAGRHRNGLA